MDAIDDFATAVESFAAWASSGNDSGANAARNALLHITRLYLGGLQLPASAESMEALDMRVEIDEWKSILANCSRLPLDYYGEVFNPLPVPPEEPVVGSLADDIADIYRDVVSGLRHYRAGDRDEAVWQWKFYLQTHWGEHATSAMRALHCWLVANAPEQLSAPQ